MCLSFLDPLLRQGRGVREATRDFHLAGSSAISCRLPGVTGRVSPSCTTPAADGHGVVFPRAS
ncbi:UNVERIFIED_CONTAM: hypothetical protein PYX00_000617 [Menopon gallinae]|uniref:Uncharacterized protein n=1 Tax=Menopon gallinae TaxID=328185 RepID=A0AAW2IB18_9NEOP